MPEKYKSSPIFGWLAAGADLVSSQLETTASMVSKRLDDTQDMFTAMQEKGEQVESELKRSWQPSAMVDSAQQLVTSLPVISSLFCNKEMEGRAQKLNALSAKVDLLVEQVALLAAKQAAEKVAQDNATTAPTKRKTTAKRTTASTTKASASKSTTAAKPAKSSAKTAASTTKASTAKTSTAKASTAKKAPAAKKATATTKSAPAKDTGTTSAANANASSQSTQVAKGGASSPKETKKTDGE